MLNNFDVSKLNEREFKKLISELTNEWQGQKKEEKKSKKRVLPKVVRPDQVRAFLTSFDLKDWYGLRHRVAFQLMYRCGLRNSEVCNLTNADVDAQTGFVYVQRGKRSVDRYVPIDTETLSLCEQWRSRRLKVSPYFLHSRTGKRLPPRYLRRVADRVSEDLGIYVQDGHKKRPLWPHVLRHCYATERMEEGVALPVIQKLLGHADIQSTQVYMSVRPELLKDAVKEMDPIGGVYFAP